MGGSVFEKYFLKYTQLFCRLGAAALKSSLYFPLKSNARQDDRNTYFVSVVAYKPSVCVR